MIDVPQLDLFLKALYYWLNYDEYLKYFDVLEDLFSWKDFFDKNQGTFPPPPYFSKFGFVMKPVTAKGMFGEVELITKRGDMFLPIPGLSVYPRLLYYKGYLPEPIDFEKHEYFFMYYPKLIRPRFTKNSEGTLKTMITMGWTGGTMRYDKDADKYLIAYNVAVPVNIRVIIEEELHSLGGKVHGLPTVDEIVSQIESKDPTLIRDIEDSLNRVLSTEENRFKELGDLLQKEYSSELNLMKEFIVKFEVSIIESID